MKFTITPTMLTQDRVEWEMKQEIDGVTTALSRAVCDLKDQAIRAALIKLGWTPPLVPGKWSCPTCGEIGDTRIVQTGERHEQDQCMRCGSRGPTRTIPLDTLP